MESGQGQGQRSKRRWSREEIYKAVSSKVGKGVEVPIELCFYNPREVYEGLRSNLEVKRWLEYIADEYQPTRSFKVLLLYPCSTIKPYPKSFFYKQLFKTLSELGEDRGQVHLVTVSEPFGLVPEEFYGKKTEVHDWENRWYDCPGLFEWWCSQYGQPFEKLYLHESIRILATYVSRFLKRSYEAGWYAYRIAFVRTFSSKLREKDDHTHVKIVRLASKLSGVPVEILPSKEMVEKIVREIGEYAWNRCGVRHPYAQQLLLDYLKSIIRP